MLKELKESKSTANIEDAIKLVDYAYQLTEKYWEGEVQPERADFNKIANYLGAALDTLRELNDRGNYAVKESKKKLNQVK